MKKSLFRRLLRLTSMGLGAVLLGGTLSACAPLMIGGAISAAMVATDRRTSGAQLDDQGIELRSANRLREVLGERGNVNVISYNRQVLLTGEVATEQDKALVERTVAGVENVRSVVNELGVLGSTSLTQRSSDALVTGRVKAAMMDARDVPASAFKVVTTRGTVYLMGRVTPDEAARATTIARNTQGVQRVVRVLEIITPEELARIQPAPPPASSAATTPAQ
jgi:osmotically-inducible protein OsmY